MQRTISSSQFTPANRLKRTLSGGTLLVLLLIWMTGLGPSFAQEKPVPQELEWDALIPADYRPEKIMNQYGDIGAMDDNDPRAQKIMDQLKELWDKAPIVTELDGRLVKLPGFVVPLEGDGVKLTEFFLVEAKTSACPPPFTICKARFIAGLLVVSFILTASPSLK